MTRYQNKEIVYSGCVVVGDGRGRFGGLSNKASGFQLKVNGLLFGSSEALFQACRYPGHPEWQAEIGKQASAAGARRMAGIPERVVKERTDWVEVREEVMGWVLRVKLAQNPARMRRLLADTRARMIVQRSGNDCFWGAVPDEDGVLVGQNRIGHFLCGLRGVGRGPVAPPSVPGFLVNGTEVGEIADCAWWRMGNLEA